MTGSLVLNICYVQSPGLGAPETQAGCSQSSIPELLRERPVCRCAGTVAADTGLGMGDGDTGGRGDFRQWQR